MGPGVGKGEDEDIILNFVNEYPVIFNMTIAESNEIACSCMVSTVWWQWFSHCKSINNLEQFSAGFAAFFH